MMEEENIDRFFILTKRIVLLDVLERALHQDVRWLKQAPLKMGRAWIRWLPLTLEQIRRERMDAERKLHQSGGRILKVRQREDYREVIGKFRGYLYTLRYLNGWIRSECDDLFLYFWAGQSTREETPPKESAKG